MEIHKKKKNYIYLYFIGFTLYKNRLKPGNQRIICLLSNDKTGLS